MSETVNQIKKHRHNIRTYFKWIWKDAHPFFPSLSFMTVLMSGASAAVILVAVLSQKVIDAAGAGKSFAGMAVIYVVVLVFVQAAKIIQNMITIVVSEKYSFRIRKGIYDKILHARWNQVETYHSGDLNTRLTSDAGNIAAGVTDVIPNMTVLLFEMIITFFTLFCYSRGLAFFSLFFAPLAVLFSIYFGRKMKKIQMKLQQSESEYRSFLQESISNLLIIKSFQAEEQAGERFANLRNRRFQWVYQKGRLNIISSSFLEFTFQTGYIVAFFWGAYCISRHTLTFGGMTVFLTLINRIQGPLMELTSYIPQLVSIFTSTERIRELEELEDEVVEDTAHGNALGIRFDKLSFSYENKEIFRDLSFEIHAGEIISLMGESGIGKTTLIRLVMSLLQPSSGNLYLVDQNDELRMTASMRKYISYVPQGNTIISGEIAEVIRLARPDASEEEIVQALRQAQIYDAICELPEGIHSQIGERGSGLSEGQLQRIAIARALIRKTPILILDEATSGLDEDTELRILSQVKNLNHNPCCIIISHRRTVLDFCDRWFYISEQSVFQGQKQ